MRILPTTILCWTTQARNRVSNSAADNRSNPLGARGINELLQFRFETPPGRQILVTGSRSRHGFAVLVDKLKQLITQGPEQFRLLSLQQLLLRESKASPVALPFTEGDWGMVQVLDDLFEQLHQDTYLDEEAVDWFVDLRLSILLYALHDQSLFFARQNVVRRLLNQCYTALLSNTEKNRLVYRKFLGVLKKRIFKEFNGVPSDLHALCIEAQSFFAAQHQQFNQVEHKIKVQETEKRQVHVAEERVVAELNRIVAGQALPPTIIEFLHRPWYRAMQRCSMEDGGQGQQWKRYVRVTESLVEYAINVRKENNADKYRKFLAVLMRNISSLLPAAQPTESEQELVTEAEAVLAALAQGMEIEYTQASKLQLSQVGVKSFSVNQASASALSQVENLAEGDWVRLETGSGHYELARITCKGSQQLPYILIGHNGNSLAKKNAIQLAQLYECGKLQPVSSDPWWNYHFEQYFEQLSEQRNQWLAQLEEQVPELIPTLKAPDPISKSEPNTVVEESVLEEPEIAPEETGASAVDSDLPEPEEPSDSLPDLDDHALAAALQAIEQLNVGGWITYLQDGRELRLKLAVKLASRDKLVFVNHLGVKTLDTDRHQLASWVATGVAMVLDTGGKFDNTLERVVRNIQHDKLNKG